VRLCFTTSFHTCIARSEVGVHLPLFTPVLTGVRQHDISTTTTEELEFDEKFARECAFTTTLSAVTPSNIRWGDRVEEDRLTHGSDSEGDQTQFPWTPSSEGVTGAPRIASVSELSSR
jgi:hypothetical protein